MNLLIVIPTLVGIAALGVAIVNAIGADHHEKRRLLRVVAMLFGFGLLAFGLGWWLNHNGDLQPKGNAANEAKDAQSNDSKVVHKHLTPEYIQKIMEESPPLARDMVAKQFIGVPISWDGKLAGSSSIAGKTMIMLDSNGDNFFVTIELPKHNFLLQAKKGTILHVDGVIDKVSRLYIEIKDAFVQLKSD
jgi:hypothetical protein